MKFNFPETIFARSNTAQEQLQHICSELAEAQADFNAGEIDRGDLELVDLYHSLETYFRIRNKGRGRGYIHKLFCEVERKNRIRGYYK